jgi:hypothetical protein
VIETGLSVQDCIEEPGKDPHMVLAATVAHVVLGHVLPDGATQVATNSVTLVQTGPTAVGSHIAYGDKCVVVPDTVFALVSSANPPSGCHEPDTKVATRRSLGGCPFRFAPP